MAWDHFGQFWFFCTILTLFKFLLNNFGDFDKFYNFDNFYNVWQIFKKFETFWQFWTSLKIFANSNDFDIFNILLAILTFLPISIILTFYWQIWQFWTCDIWDTDQNTNKHWLKYWPFFLTFIEGLMEVELMVSKRDDVTATGWLKRNLPWDKNTLEVFSIVKKIKNCQNSQ